MRQQRQSGPRGLAGMAPASLIAADASGAIPLLRPLLTLRRQSLRAFLAAAGASFIDDPSNEDTAFERVRVRKLLSTTGDICLSTEALIETARCARAAALQAEAAENARFAALCGGFDEWGGATLAAKSMTGGDAALFSRLVQAVTGTDHAPNDAMAREVLQTALAGRTATLGGAMARCDNDRLHVFREPAAVTGRAGVPAIAPVDLAPDARTLWDARFIVENRLGKFAVLRALGDEASGFAAAARDSDLMAAAPSLWIDGVLAGLPGENDGFHPLAEERFFQRVNRFH
jgi:tRNA(Ile)-lysidine synthase